MDIKHLSTEKVKALLDAIEDTRPVVTSGQPAGLWHLKCRIDFNPPPPKKKDIQQQKIWACHSGMCYGYQTSINREGEGIVRCHRGYKTGCNQRTASWTMAS